MNNIQKNAIDTYNENLDYLKNTDNALYNKIAHLSNLIESSKYNENYYLEYIEEEKQFDIFDIREDKFIYNKKPAQYNKKVLKVTNFDKKNSYTLLKGKYYNQKDNKTFCSISEYVNIFNKNTDSTNKIFKKIEKFVFIGTILGSHIPLINEKFKSNIYFISEPNLEIFRLSLFVVNYAKIGLSSTIIFSIMDTRQDFVKKFKQYLTKDFKSNYMVKYYSTSYSIEDYFERILEAIGVYTPFGFPYTYILNKLIKPSFENMNRYKVLNTNMNHTLLQDKPVLLLAAGPSLTKNIDWINEHQDSYFIVAISAALIKLCSHDIKPDIIVSADPSELNVKHIPETIRETIKGIPFLASAMSHKKLLDTLYIDDVYLFEAMTAIKDTSSSISGASVGEVTFHLSAILGAQNIYMLGTDLALDQERGSTHIDDYFANKIFDIKEQSTNNFTKEGTYSHRHTTMIVKGNFTNKVVTTTTFVQSIHAYNVIINELKEIAPSLKIFNLSDGAYIEGATPCEIKSLDNKNNIDKTNSDISNYLSMYSSSSFSKDELSTIQESKEFVDLCIERLNKLNSIKLKSYSEFINQRSELFGLLFVDAKEYQRLYLYDLFINYILMTEPYIAYNFNENIKNEANLIKKVKKVWIEQMKTICNKYKTIVEL